MTTRTVLASCMHTITRSFQHQMRTGGRCLPFLSFYYQGIRVCASSSTLPTTSRYPPTRVESALRTQPRELLSALRKQSDILGFALIRQQAPSSIDLRRKVRRGVRPQGFRNLTYIRIAGFPSCLCLGSNPVRSIARQQSCKSYL